MPGQSQERQGQIMKPINNGHLNISQHANMYWRNAESTSLSISTGSDLEKSSK